MSMPDRYVLDASVGIKLCVDEPLPEQAPALLRAHREHVADTFLVPDLFYVECANILWKYVNRNGYPAENATNDIKAIPASGFAPSRRSCSRPMLFLLPLHIKLRPMTVSILRWQSKRRLS